MSRRERFRVTYEITTPESAAEGDVSERGFIGPYGGPFPANPGHPVQCAEMSLRRALDLCCPQEDAGRWFNEVDPRRDYATGAEELRSLHPPEGITAASYGRLKRLLGVR